MRLYFCDFENFGDALSPYLMRHLLKCDIVSATPANADIMGVGSIFFEGEYFFFDRKKLMSKEMLKWLWYKIKGLWQKPLIVWGSAFLHEPKISSRILHYRRLDIRAVRGRKTLNLLKEAGFVLSENVALGDPGLLYAELIPNLVHEPKRYDLAVVSRHVNPDCGRQMELRAREVGINAKMIDLMNPDPLQTLRDIAASNKVLSAAMHPLIVADSLGIPNALIDVMGYNRWKIDDYYSAFGMTAPEALAYEDFLANPLKVVSMIPDKPRVPSHEVERVKQGLVDALFAKPL